MKCIVYLNTIQEMNEFVKIVQTINLYFELNIKTSVCSLQQYLMKYLSNPDDAINNIDGYQYRIILGSPFLLTR